MNDGAVDSISWMRVALAFSVVFGLLAVFGFLLSYFKKRGFSMPGTLPQNRRIQIMETLTLDPRRRLVIVRRDEAEHLLLLGINQDIVVESHLTKNSKPVDISGRI